MKNFGPIKFADLGNITKPFVEFYNNINLDGDGFMDMIFLTCDKKLKDDTDDGCYLNFVYNIPDNRYCTSLSDSNCLPELHTPPKQFNFDFDTKGKVLKIYI